MARLIIIKAIYTSNDGKIIALESFGKVTV